MSRWPFGSRKKHGAKPAQEADRFKRLPGRPDPRGLKPKRGRARPAEPSSWNDSDRDFITRYGDPFDDG